MYERKRKRGGSWIRPEHPSEYGSGQCEPPIAALTNYCRFITGLKQLKLRVLQFWRLEISLVKIKVLAGLCSFWELQGRLHP